MSRLAFSELIEQPESVGTARARVKSKLWYFLCVGFHVGIRLLGIYLLGAIAIGIIGGVLSAISSTLGIIAFVLLIITLLIILIRFFSRLFVAEIPLAVENNMTGAQSVDRSWQLTAEAVGRIQIVAVIAFLVTLPLVALTGYLPNILFPVLAPDFAETGLAALISFILSLAGGVLLLPFWQIIKAVVYYDLRSRQEGLDLQLRDRRS
jgi:Na+-transporting methylmalonyl-CoA/oxaloacetate decarboxylase gamma subunit